MMPIEAAVTGLTGRPVLSVDWLGGGSLSEVALVNFTDGSLAVVKRGVEALLHKEAAMLRHMAGAAAVPIPAVLAEGEGLLLLEWCPDDGRYDAAWDDVARCLAAVHGVVGERYGFRFDYALGPIEQSNGAAENWVDFWRERRLLPLSRPLPAAVRGRVEALAGRLSELIPAKPAPVLLHGDFWSGNILVDEGQVSGLIDPACYYGDGEVDLAMLSLFSNVPEQFWDAYGRPDAGFFEERQALYQLWPLMVHVRLFGATYLPMLNERLDRLGV